MKLVILSPDREIFSGDVKSVQVPGTSGGFQMLEGHAPMVSSLKKGQVNVEQSSGERLTFSVEGGFVEILNNEIALLVSGVAE
jgi:F-type H+-transporting ATPase subunit epsilon